MTKCVCITGAGSGIGQGLAIALAAAGFEIVASDMLLDQAQKTVDEIQLAAGSAHAHAAEINVCDQASIDRALDAFKIDILINCAGMQHVSRLEDFPQDKWDQLIDIMLNGSCRMTKAVLPHMRSQGFGRIINIGSIHSLIASAYKSAYVAAKHGLLGFSKTIALETADADITINTICPSYVQTPLVEKQIASQAKERGISESEVIEQVMLKPMPKKAFISMEELAATALFLIQDTARNITGQEIVIDGGWSIQ
ncbi:MAG: 3-hydroxybutyrate dehydrogenase [Planctomycetes bacterium]|nr:3-hydroxybutyrate dehydrogenase [Planctomycetota bacterium]